MSVNSVPIDWAQVKNLSNDQRLKPVHASELPEGLFSRIMQVQERMLEQKYTQMPDTAENPAYQPYASVTLNGEVVAEIDNHGFTATSHANGAKIQRGLPMEGAGGEITGPALAKARAEYIAEALGGEVSVAETALTQNQFSAIPQVKPSIDVDAMMQDPQYAKLMQLRRMRTEFMAQKIGQELEETMATQIAGGSAQNESAQVTKNAGAAEKFLEYMDMSPEERYWDAFLKKNDMTQEEYNALPPEEKQALMKEFEQEFKEKLADDALQKREKEAAS